MNYLIYARVSPRGSSWAANETSIPLQIEACKRHVEFLGGTVTNIIQDEFESGKDDDRPGYRQILHELQSDNAPWDVLVVYKIDRLTRSLRDAVDFLELLHRHKKGIISIVERIDLSSPMGRASMYIFCVFSQMVREETAERIKDKMVYIAQNGGYAPGHAPLGYKRPEPHNNNLVIDERAAETVVEIFRRYAAGQSMKQLALEFDTNSNSIAHILRNRHYLGKIVYDGREYEGNHPAIIDDDLWERVQLRLPKKQHGSRPMSQKYPYILAGMIYCHCGSRLTPYSSHGRNKKYFYYRCRDRKKCRAKQISAPEIEGAVLDALKSEPVNQEDIEAAICEIHEMRDNAKRDTKPEVAKVRRSLKLARDEQKKIKAAFLNGIVAHENKQIWNDELSRVNREIERLKGRHQELSRIQNVDLGIFDNAESVLRELKSYSQLLDAAATSTDLQRQALIARVERIDQVEDGFNIKFNYSSGATNKINWYTRLVLVAPFPANGGGKVILLTQRN